MTAPRLLLTLACLVMPAVLRAEPAAPPAAPPARPAADASADRLPPAGADKPTIVVRGRSAAKIAPPASASLPADKRKVWVLIFDGDPTMAPPEYKPRKAPKEDADGESHDPDMRMVDPGLADWIKTNSREAVRSGATHIIYQINSYGGMLKSAIDIMDFISREMNPKVHTIAYVPDKAISAGAMIALSCRDMIVGPNAKIGASAPVAMGGEIGEFERAKIESVLRSQVRTLAQANGWPEVLCEAMITRTDSPIYRVFNKREGRFQYFFGKDLPADAAAYDLSAKRRVLGEKELLTMTGQEAYDYGFADAVVPGMDGVLKHYGLPKPAQSLEAPEREDFMKAQTTKSLNSPFTVGVILAAAIVGLLLGLKTGELQLLLLGLGAFGVFFWVKHNAGTAEPWEILLTVAGIGCILLELIAFPTAGGLLIAGAIMFVVGLLLCFLPPFSLPDLGPSAPGAPVPGIPADPGGPSDARTAVHDAEFNSNLAEALVSIFGAFVAALAGTWLVLANLHRIPFLRKAILVETGPSGPTDDAKGTAAPSPFAPILPGELGRADTALRPAGKGRFGERLLDVVADGSFVDAGAIIEVVVTEGNRIVVRKAG